MSRLFADTLFKRLFVLMWLALIASHFIGADARFVREMQNPETLP
jgi:hypothetical protein